MENLFTKKIAFTRGGRAFGWGASPDADWKVIFITALVLAAVIAAWDTLTYLKVRNGDLAQDAAVAEGDAPTLNTEALKRAVEYYKAKAAEFEKFKKGTKAATIADPSM